MRHDIFDIVHGQIVLCEQSAYIVADGAYCILKGFLTHHVDVRGIRFLGKERGATHKVRNGNDFIVALYGNNGIQITVNTALQYRCAGTVAENNTGTAVVPVYNSAQTLCTDDQNFLCFVLFLKHLNLSK